MPYTYTVEGKEYNWDSSVNQRIKDTLVNRDVEACVTDMVDTLLRADNDEWTLEDFVNSTYPVCPECGSPSLREEGEWYFCEDCGDSFKVEDADTDYADPYEYWIVSPWFGEKLKEAGECVLERWGGWIWGRQATGQSISMDGVIGDIAYKMGILEGQAFSWADQVA